MLPARQGPHGRCDLGVAGLPSPRLSAPAGRTPDAGVGVPPRPARLRRCGGGGGERPAGRAPFSAGHRGGASALRGCGAEPGGAAASGRVMSASAGERGRGGRGTAAVTANGAAGRERPRAGQPMGSELRWEPAARASRGGCGADATRGSAAATCKHLGLLELPRHGREAPLRQAEGARSPPGSSRVPV